MHNQKWASWRHYRQWHFGTVYGAKIDKKNREKEKLGKLKMKKSDSAGGDNGKVVILRQRNVNSLLGLTRFVSRFFFDRCLLSA